MFKLLLPFVAFLIAIPVLAFDFDKVAKVVQAIPEKSVVKIMPTITLLPSSGQTFASPSALTIPKQSSQSAKHK